MLPPLTWDSTLKKKKKNFPQVDIIGESLANVI